MRKKIFIGCLVIVCVIAVYSFGWPYVDLAKRKNALKKYDVQKEWKDNSLEYEDAKYFLRVVMTMEEWDAFRETIIKNNWRREAVTTGTKNIINSEMFSDEEAGQVSEIWTIGEDVKYLFRSKYFTEYVYAMPYGGNVVLQYELAMYPGGTK
ncbi:MAG: hypothetical protein K6E71_07675 [Lachnospiraceae bacterium]|nr:hypothetical protein [Lachnospiraceae bacterium]